MDTEIKKEFDDLFEVVNKTFEIVEAKMATKEDLQKLEAKMATKEDLQKLEAKMATKQDLGKLKLDLVDAMADKNAELRGDLVVLMRKEDTKLISLVDVLKKKMILTENEAKMILTMEPFPRLIM